MPLLTPEAFISDENNWVYGGLHEDNHVLTSKDPVTLEGYAFHGHWMAYEPIHDLDDSADFNSIAATIVARWNLYNPHTQAIQVGCRWLVPDVGNQPATDMQATEKLIEIYKNTRKIMVDIFLNDSCVVYNDIVVYRLERTSVDGKVYLTSTRGTSPRDTQELHTNIRPLTRSCIKNLLYLSEQVRPESIKDKYIELYFVEQLRVFRKSSASLDNSILRMLHAVAMQPLSKLDKHFLLFNQLKNARQILEFCMQCVANAEIDGLNLEQMKLQICRIQPFIDTVGSFGYNLTQLAVVCNQVGILEHLISIGADVNAAVCTQGVAGFHKTPIELAYRMRKDGCIRLLLNAKVTLPPIKYRETHLFHYAACHGLTDSVIHMLNTLNIEPDTRHCQDNNGLSIFTTHTLNAHRRAILSSIDSDGQTVVDIALQHGQLDTVQALFSAMLEEDDDYEMVEHDTNVHYSLNGGK